MSLIAVQNNDQIEAEKTAAVQAAIPQEPQMTGLAGHILTCWEAAKRAKQTVERQMLKNLRQRNGEYEPDRLKAIQEMGGSEIFMMITAAKCRAARAWIMDVLRPAGDKPWTIQHTPIPDLPQDVEAQATMLAREQMIQAALAEFAQTGKRVGARALILAVEQRTMEIKEMVRKAMEDTAKKAAERMERKIHDQLTDGGWDAALEQVVDDIITFPGGVIKGPIMRKRRVPKWVNAGGRWSVQTTEELVKEYTRVSPFDFYPEGDSVNINDGFVIERMRFSRQDIASMIGVPGYSTEAIRAVLAEYGRGGLRSYQGIDSDRARQERREGSSLYESQKIEALEYWGSVQGLLLLQHGIPVERIPDPLIDYEINAILIGRHVIKAVLNPDQTGKKPYGMACWEEIPGSLWGRGLPEIIFDIQEACNAAARAIVNNMAMASGPQVEVDEERLAIGQNKTKVWPWRIWLSTSKQIVEGQKAVNFFQPTMIVEPLMKVYEKFLQQADEQTVPRYAHGDTSVGGAGQTSSGLSMLITAASRGIKDVIANIDAGIIEPPIERTYDYNMRFEKDESIKGDCRVVARGSSSLMAKEQRNIRLKEILETSNNDIDNEIFGLEGRRELWKETLKSVEMPLDKVLPEGQVLAQTGTPGAPGQPGQEKAQTLDPSGQPVAGQDNALFAKEKK